MQDASGGGARRRAWLMALGILVLGAIPPAAYRLVFFGAPTVTAREARARLAAGGAALVDVRSSASHAAWHAEGAVSWPLAMIRAESAAEGMPEALRGKRLLVACDLGDVSAEAVRRLRRAGIDAWSVVGGMDDLAAGCATRAGACPVGLALRDSPRHEQVLAVVNGFVIKPSYMLIALVLAWLLRGRRDPDLAALRWSMILFFAGEFACLVNYAAFDDGSHLVEYLHGYGMALAAGFGAYALFEALDRRVVGLSAAGERCALLGLCRPCAKNAAAPCGLERLFRWMIPFTMVLAFVPLTAPLRTIAYDTMIFDTRYTYDHPLVYQVYEIRGCPALALGLMAASWLALVFGRQDRVNSAKVLFSGGLGLLAFGAFRMMLLALYRENLVWFVFWEEATEMLGILGVAAVLWVFRKGLWASRPGEGGATTP